MAPPDPVAAFIDAACVPLDAGHATGGLEAANAVLATHPHVASASVHTAAVLGDDAAVRRFLAADPAAATAAGGPRGWDALTHLCFSRYLRLDPTRSDGFVRAATALLDAGADANTGWREPNHQPYPTRESAIYGAAGVAHHAGLTRLLLERGADPNDDETPYHAPEGYDLAALAALVESGKLTADSLATMLLRKADWHDHDGVKYLLAHGAEANRLTRWGYTALHQAVRRDNALETVELLLDHGADPALPNTLDGRSAAALAARRGRGDVLAALDLRGVAVGLAGVERLIAACARDDAVTVGSIAAAEPGLVAEVVAMGGTLLAEFAGNGNTAGVGRLLDLGVPVGAVYREGDGYFGIAPDSTALHVAAWRSRPETVKLLIARGAAVDAADGHGRTPLMLAVKACVDSYWTERRTPESVAALLAAGASAAGVAWPCGYGEVDELLGRRQQAGGGPDNR
ncbi:MAG TPA: ankyrin repeat domain-containing protein [Gemmataceae bacterium]|jgi:ankyrin repeat protein